MLLAHVMGEGVGNGVVETATIGREGAVAPARDGARMR